MSSISLFEDLERAAFHVGGAVLTSAREEEAGGRNTWDAYVADAGHGHAIRVHVWESEAEFGFEAWGRSGTNVVSAIHPLAISESYALALCDGEQAEEQAYSLQYESAGDARSPREYVLALLLGAAMEGGLAP